MVTSWIGFEPKEVEIPTIKNPFLFKDLNEPEDNECTSPIFPVFGKHKNNPFSTKSTNHESLRLKAYIDVMEDEILYHSNRIEFLKSSISKMKDKLIQANENENSFNSIKKQKF